jgi:hypothetical protein
MRRLAIAAALAFTAACSNGFWACGRGGGGSCCSATPEVSPEVDYVGTIPSVDGGTPTRVKLVVGPSGNARLTFVRDGVEIAETFAGP